MTESSNAPMNESLMRQAYEQLQAGEFKDAADTFSASLALGLQQAEALRGRGLARLQLKQWALAAEDFSAAKALAPEEVDNWVDLGVSLALDHQAYPAIEVFESLLKQHPECVRGRVELGLLYIHLGAIPKGREQLQQAIAQRPTVEQRRLIESVLSQQDQLDKKRFYRPDFEALHRQQRDSVFRQFLRTLRHLFKPTSTTAAAHRDQSRKARHAP